MHLLGRIFLLAIVSASIVEGRPRVKSHSHDFYGSYNLCKYNIWPWPAEVMCDVDSGSAFLSSKFSIFFSDDSQAINSTIMSSGTINDTLPYSFNCVKQLRDIRSSSSISPSD